MGNLLFSPNGRIGPSAFMKGLGILALISALVTIMPIINYSLASIFGLLSLVLLIPLFFILIKRCHDAGKSGWMSILFFLLIVILGFVAQYIAQQMTGGAEMAAMKEATKELARSGAGVGEMMSQSMALAEEYGPAIAKNTAIPTAVAGFIGTMIGGFLTNMILKSDGGENQFGPAT